MLNLFVIIILSYLVGSIPTSIIVAKKVKGIDIRNHGSGNAGGTNTLRVLGWKYGILVMVIDSLKGTFAVLVISRIYLSDSLFQHETIFNDFAVVQIIAGISTVLGHIWTIFAGFKGGKGVATALGFLLGIVTVDVLLAFAIFFFVVFVSKYVSLASIIAAFSLPFIMIIRENIFNVNIQSYTTLLPFIILISSIVIFTHKKNIVRLINGNETKIKVKKNK